MALIKNEKRQGQADISQGRATGEAYFFGDYRLCPDTRELSRNGQPIDVQDKVFSLLAYLVENHDRAVPREELVESIWAGKPLSETVLSRCVMKARRAIGDDCDSPQFIRTIRAFGYRFVGEVMIKALEECASGKLAFSQSDGMASGPLESALLAKTSGSTRVRKWPIVLMIAVLLTLGIGTGLMVQPPSESQTKTASEQKKPKPVDLALMPVESGSGTTQDLSEPVTMLLDRGLSKVPWLNVMSLSSSSEVNLADYPSHCILSTSLNQTAGNYEISYTLEIPGRPTMKGEISGDNPFLLADEIIVMMGKMTRKMSLSGELDHL